MTDPEREVKNFLEERRLWWVFQFPVFVYDDKKIPRLYSPDFFVPRLGLFIEVCGSEEFDYAYRKNVYKKNGVAVVFLHHYKHPKELEILFGKKGLRD